MAKTSPILRKARPRTLRNELADILREAILDGKFEPGQRLVESALAEQLGVARGSLREALAQLEQQRLINVSPNRSVRVAQPTETDTWEAVVLRVHLETLAVRVVATRHDKESLDQLDAIVREMENIPYDNQTPEQTFQRVISLDREFHNCLINATGSQVLSQSWTMLSPYLWAMTLLGRIHRGQSWPPWNDIQETLQADPEEHRALVEAIRSGDVEKAEQEILNHNIVSLPQASLHPMVKAALRWPDHSQDDTSV